MISALLITLASFGNVDSVRTEVVKGKTFLVHRVEAKETLFSISRKYGVALLAVVENNPGADSGLEIGQEIKVPYVPNNRKKTAEGIVHRVGDKETLYSLSKQYGVTVDELKAWNKVPSSGIKPGDELLIKDKTITPAGPTTTKTAATPSNFTHVVAAGETLYSLSRKYNLSVDKLKELNKLSGNELKPGQVISVAQPSEASTTTTTSTISSTAQPNQPQPTGTTATKTADVISIAPITGVTGTDETREKGMAALLEGTEGNRKYLGYHRTLKTGSIIRVINSVTQKNVFVRIIGPLPPTEANDVVVKISKAAYDKLEGQDKFPVEITYFK